MPTDPFFHMRVKAVFSIRGRGVVVTGSVDRGTVRAGDEIIIRGGLVDKKATVTSLEAFQQAIEEAKAGDAVGILFKNVDRQDIDRGYELLSPDLAG